MLNERIYRENKEYVHILTIIEIGYVVNFPQSRVYFHLCT